MAMQSSEHFETSTLLTYGYVRYEQDIFEQIIPSSITELVFNFYFISNPNQYIWKISDASLLNQIKTAQPTEIFTSPEFSICNLQWQLEFYPNGTTLADAGMADIYASLVTLSPTIHTIQYRATYSLVEKNVYFKTSRGITHEKLYCESWPDGTLTTTDIQRYDELTFKFHFDLRAVFDNRRYEITDQFLQMNNTTNPFNPVSKEEQLNAKLDVIIAHIENISVTMTQMEKRMDNIELKISEQGKHNYDKLLEEMRGVKQSNINSEKQKIKLWLENDVKLPEYYQVFIENGIEDLVTVSLLTMDIIKQIGIHKVGHQLKYYII